MPKTPIPKNGLTLKFLIKEGGQAAAIQFSSPDEELPYFEADAVFLAEIIETLGTIRRSLSDMVPLELDPNARLLAEPVKRVVYNPPSSTLTFRHESFGWLSFQFSPGALTALARGIIDQPPEDAARN